jgi:Spy/CpxP family protein refolding chaperone
MSPYRSLLGGTALLLIASAAAAQPPGGFPGGLPQPGQVLPGIVQDRLNLTDEQKKQLDELQKDVDARLAKILTPEQKQSLQQMQRAFPGPGGFPGGPGGGFPGGPPGGFGGAFGQANRLDDVKKQLGATDEEWKVIGPKLQKVIAARQVLTPEVRAVGFGFAAAPPFGAFGGGPRGGGDTRPGEGPPGGGQPPGGGFGPGPMATNAVTQAQAELKTVLDDPKHTAADVKEKVAAVRKARQKARADLDTAHKDLLQLLTAEQEAVLVSLGYIE